MVWFRWLLRSDLRRVLLEGRPPLAPFEFRHLPSSRLSAWTGLVLIYLVIWGAVELAMS
jgi:hypothetical protein